MSGQKGKQGDRSGSNRPNGDRKQGGKGQHRPQQSGGAGGGGRAGTGPKDGGVGKDRGKGKGKGKGKKPRKVKLFRRPPQGVDMNLPDPLFQKMFAVQTNLTGIHHVKVRDSYGVSLSNPEFMERFLELWMEHIEGFGKRMKTKRDLSENEKNMEWRQRLKQKEKADISHRATVIAYSGGEASMTDREIGTLAKVNKKKEQAELAAEAQAQYRALKAAQRAAQQGKKKGKRDYLRL